MSDQTTTDPAEIRQAVRDELDSMLPVDWERDFNGRVVIDAAVKVVCERLAETAGREQVARQEIERLGNLLTRATDEIDAIRDALDPFGVFDSHGEPANVTLVEAAGLLVSEWQAVREALSGVDFGDHAGCSLAERVRMVCGNLDNLRAEIEQLREIKGEYDRHAPACLEERQQLRTENRHQGDLITELRKQLKTHIRTVGRQQDELKDARNFRTEVDEAYADLNERYKSAVRERDHAMGELRVARAALSGGDQ